MSGDSEREARQLHLASVALVSYRDRTLELASLVQRLGALLDEFRLQDPDWVEEFRRNWWTLEQVHAVSLDRELVGIPDDLQVMVDEAVDLLGFLVDAALGNLRS
jgi:hypothetical protein